MLARLHTLWEQISTGLWLVPVSMTIAAILLAWVTIELPFLDFQMLDGWWLSSGDSNAVEALLSALLTSMITLATLALSITMVVLTVAAGNMGPRLIRSFMADKRSQIMLGYFVATVVYIILVMLAVQDADDGSAQHLAATMSMVLSIGAVFLLLFFVHHLGRSIIADTIIQRVSESLDLTLEEMLLPDREDAADQEAIELPVEKAATLSFEKGAYVQAVEYGRLKNHARQAGVVIYLDFRPGNFLLPHGDHGRVFPRSGLTRDLKAKILDCIALGGQPTAHQDLEFSIRQLVEVALRALSPGINDPFTAVAVIDRLALFLAAALRRGPARALWRDDEGEIRVISRTTTFRGMVDTAFNQIRQSGGTQPTILIHLMSVLLQLALQARQPLHRKVLADHVELVLRAGERNIAEDYDLEPLRRRAHEALRHLARQ